LVRELYKIADDATEGHIKALLRLKNYILGSKDHSLFLQPKFNNDVFYVEVISDSEYAGDPGT
jgi:hypothetical protein